MTPCGLGDLLRALSEVSRDQWDTVSLALGFEQAVESSPRISAVKAAQAENRPPTISISASPRRYAAPTTQESGLPTRPASSTVDMSDREVSWLPVSTLSRSTGGQAATGSAPPHKPLLHPRQAPALLSTLCATTRAAGPIDIRVVVDWLARRRAMRQLPRRNRPTLARGVQVLVDVGEGLKPFVADCTEVTEALKRLVGEGLVAEGWFIDDPAHGVGFDYELAAYKAPAPAVPVLLLTDLGIGGGGARRRWPRREHLVALATQLDAQGSPALALVPYPPTRWPTGLDRKIGLVFWDRRTTVSDVRKARRRAGAVR
jgi:hypothetical protein